MNTQDIYNELKDKGEISVSIELYYLSDENNDIVTENNINIKLKNTGYFETQINDGFESEEHFLIIKKALENTEEIVKTSATIRGYKYKYDENYFYSKNEKWWNKFALQLRKEEKKFKENKKLFDIIKKQASK